MDKWKLEIKNLDLKELHENYLNQINTITTIYSVIAYTDQQLKDRKTSPLSKIKIALSTDFDKGFTTVKDEEDIYSCSVSGKLHQINCYQAVVSLASNFEHLIDSLVSMLGITRNSIKQCKVLSYNNEIPSPLLQKVIAIHKLPSIESNMTGNHELQYFYKIILLRNRITHRQGLLKNNDTQLSRWADKKLNSIEFNQNNIDDFVHFFLLPITSLILSIDCHLENKVK